MSSEFIEGLKEQFSVLQEVHRQLEGAIDESLQGVWHFNDGLLTWLRLLPLDDASIHETANHFMEVSVWVERKLFSLRNKPLCSKGVYRDLTLLKEAISERSKMYASGDVESQRILLGATLSVLQIATGPRNAALAEFAERVDRLLEQDLTPLNVDLPFPDRLIPSLAAILSHLESLIVEDEDHHKKPQTPAVVTEDPADDEFVLPDLDDF